MPVWNRPMNKKIRKIAALAWQHSIKDAWFPEPPPRDVICERCHWSMTYQEDSLGGFYICKVCGHVHDHPVADGWD